VRLGGGEDGEYSGIECDGWTGGSMGDEVETADGIAYE